MRTNTMTTRLLASGRSRGVTLLELLVAVSIFSVCMTVVFSVYMRAQSEVRSGMGRGQLEDRVRLVLRRFTSDLRSATYIIEATDTTIIYITRNGDEVDYLSSESQLLRCGKPVFRPPCLLEAFSLEYVSQDMLLDTDGDSVITYDELDLNRDGVLADEEDVRETIHVDMVRVHIQVSEGKLKAAYRTATRLMNLQGAFLSEE